MDIKNGGIRAVQKRRGRYAENTGDGRKEKLAEENIWRKGKV